MEFNIDIKCFSCGETLNIIGSEFHTYYDGMDIIVKPCRNCNPEPEPEATSPSLEWRVMKLVKRYGKEQDDR